MTKKIQSHGQFNRESAYMKMIDLEFKVQKYYLLKYNIFMSFLRQTKLYNDIKI